MQKQNQSQPFQIMPFPHDGVKAYFITAQTSEKNMHDVFNSVTQQMEEKEAQIAFQYLFGGRQFYPQAVSAIKNLNWPLTLLHGDACQDEHCAITGTQFIAISGAKLNPIVDNDRIVGNWYDTSNARYCLLGDIRADDLSLSNKQQTRAVFEKIEKLLQQAELKFTDIARTWFYLNDLLSWYDDFNEVRTQFFHEQGTFKKRVPASTGIGAGTPAGEAIVAAIWAVKPKNEKVKIISVPSPLQCPALDYKSSFARAIEIQQPQSQLLTISGTASIDLHGKTAHLNNCKKQIELTMKVVHEILLSRKMEWKNTSRAIAYFKEINDIHLLEEYCIENHLPELPIAISHADVCRDDLLFEIELDAIKIN